MTLPQPCLADIKAAGRAGSTRAGAGLLPGAREGNFFTACSAGSTQVWRSSTTYKYPIQYLNNNEIIDYGIYTPPPPLSPPSSQSFQTEECSFYTDLLLIPGLYSGSYRCFDVLYKL